MLKQRWILVEKKAVLHLCYDACKVINCILTLKRQPYFNVETTLFCLCQINVEVQRWNNVKFGLTIETFLFLCYDAVIQTLKSERVYVETFECCNIHRWTCNSQSCYHHREKKWHYEIFGQCTQRSDNLNNPVADS